MAGALCLSSCGDEGAKRTLPLRVHSLSSCDLPSELTRGTLQLVALGDFAADNDSAEVLPLARTGASLRFPAATQAIAARVEGGGRASGGWDERSPHPELDPVLCPESATCPLPTLNYPGKSGGQGLGFSRVTQTVLAAGGNDALNADALLGFASFDTATGALVAHGQLRDAPNLPRAFATVTEFGSRLLVAGGEKPVMGVPDHDLEPYALAEVFDPGRGAFTNESIGLLGGRTHHAAVVLDDGRTLLVGGRSKVGSTSIAEYQLEIVDPESERATLAGAITARVDPSALKLSDGRVFVAGGTALDGSLVAPVGEWLTSSGRLDSTRLDSVVAPRFERAFVATPGGGVLAVGGCEDRPAASEQDASACQRCGHGCEPLDGFDAWWIDRDGRASPVALDGISAPRPVLLPGSDGSAWLVAATRATPDVPALFRFNPWAQRFERAERPRALELPSRDRPAPVEIDRDTFVWLTPSARGDRLVGLRLGTRSRYAQDLALVLLADPLDPGRPLHLTPDRALGESASYDGKLTLRDPSVSIQVADTDYEDVTISLTLSEAGEAPPVVLLGATALGDRGCPWPTGASSEPPSVVRRGRQAILRFRGGEPQRCEVEAGRLKLALRAGESLAVVSELRIRRSAD